MDSADSDRNRHILAAAGGERKRKADSGILGSIAAGATAAVAAASGASLGDSLTADVVITGQPPTRAVGKEVAPTEPNEADPNVAAGVSGTTEGAGVLDSEERTLRPREQERLRQAGRDGRRQEDECRRQAEVQRRNARIWKSDVGCIGIRDNGDYVCLDGLVQGGNSARPLSDIRR